MINLFKKNIGRKKDIWKQLNDDIPNIFHDIINEYGFTPVQTSSISTALIKNDFAIEIGIDRFYPTMIFITRNDENELIELWFENFICKKCGELEVSEIPKGNSLYENIQRELFIDAKLLKNKWGDLLNGDKRWISEYKKSEWYEGAVKVRPPKLHILSKYL